jgi:predicted ATPase
VAALVERPLGLDQFLAELRGKDLIREDPHDPHRQLYRFRHPLIREVAYDAMSKRRRATLHEDFAVWLEAAVGDRVEEYDEIVGHHLELACRYREELGADRDGGSSLLRARARWRDRAARRGDSRGDTRGRRRPAQEASSKGSGRGV